MSSTPTRKPARRTAERILEVTLDLLNRHGEPQVTTTQIAAALRISPGNLYYHYSSKDILLKSLFERYEAEMHPLLAAAAGVRDVEDAWFFVHSVLEAMWRYRFIYRDLNHLLATHRALEQAMQKMLPIKHSACVQMLLALSPTPTQPTHVQRKGQGAATRQAQRSDEMVSEAPAQMPTEASPHMQATAHNMVLTLCYWFSYEYALNPRQAMEEVQAEQALRRGAQHVLALLLPYLTAQEAQHLLALAQAYAQRDQAPPV